MQVTVGKSFFKKMDAVTAKMGEVVKDRAIEIITDAVDSSPVDTGAFVESWQVNPRGDRTALARSAAGRPSLPAGAKQAKREQEKARLVGRIESFDTEKLDGFTITNRAPHIPLIELNNRLKTGLNPKEIFAIIRNKHR
jgi:hypothetical protein